VLFENRVLRRIFGPKRDKIMGNRENSIIRSFMFSTPHQILFGSSNQGEQDGPSMWHV